MDDSICAICNRQWDRESPRSRISAFCNNCHRKWEEAYQQSEKYSAVYAISDDPHFNSFADTYTTKALDVVVECLGKLNVRCPSVEEANESRRRTDYRRMGKFDVSKIEPSL